MPSVNQLEGLSENIDGGCDAKRSDVSSLHAYSSEKSRSSCNCSVRGFGNTKLWLQHWVLGVGERLKGMEML